MSQRSAPILTVIVLTYNHEQTIARALDSVLEQETTYPYQIWICEDCSSDNTRAICSRYAAKYPGLIELIAQPTNTRGRHFQAALERITTPYLTVLEGDDYWCDTGKIQTGLDLLERDSGYVSFAHDTLFDDKITGIKKSQVHEVDGVDVQNPVRFETAPLFHMSARIYRNVVDFTAYKVPLMYDIYLFYLFLDKGDLYYHDKIMSVYQISGQGMWSKLNREEQKHQKEMALATVNRLLDYRRDAFFSAKVRRPGWLRLLKRCLGVRLGWKAYIVMEKVYDRRIKART